jgi:hypothetical protein
MEEIITCLTLNTNTDLGNIINSKSCQRGVNGRYARNMLVELSWTISLEEEYAEYVGT